MQNRRSFTRNAGLAAAGAFLYLTGRARGANDRVTLALIGGRNQGKGDALRAIKAGAEIKTFCDLDEAILGQVNPVLGKAQGREPQTEREFRRVLEDKSIDAVIIATPDHWHTHIALLACQAGKDVYVEKPLSQTIREGQMIRDAARKYRRVMQVGTQRRTIEHFRSATDFVASGALGKVCLVKAWMCQVRQSIGNPPDQDPPRTIDYDVWLGPAPKRPFNPNRFHYNWRFFWDYGNSELGNQGVHMLDVALAGIQKLRKTEHCLPTRISGHGGIYWLHDAKEVPDTQVLSYDFGDLLLNWELRSFGDQDPIEGTRAGTGFYGSDATLIVDGDGWKVYGKHNEIEKVVKNSGGSHEANFLECVKSRQRPNADVEIGRLSTTLCHLGNIVYHLGRDVRFDPQTETFGDDQAANAMLTKQYRSSYPLPKV
ncbi:MAG TPA: Gfo/Idh/MocA family oxidoreductase [Bryobacteraceae bacterium]|nr:Gfo/Idh/MocA family oxidoreductase [Bryobacteraceae bacterium]